MSVSLSEILDWLSPLAPRLANEKALGERAASVRVERPVPLGGAKASELAFFFSREYQAELPSSRPGVLITAEPFVGPLEASGLPLWRESAVVACKDPYLAMALLSARFAERLSSVAHLRSKPGSLGSPDSMESGKAQAAARIDPTAIVDASAEIGAGVEIGANCVIAAQVKIGAGTRLYPGCVIGERAEIGEYGVLFANVTVYEWATIGRDVRVHAGARIGSDGFGYAPIREGGQVTGHQKIYHLGRVRIGDRVEIGANSCIDRATFGETVIEDDAKLDNLVHVGHNARVERGAILCGGVALAGGARIGRFAYIGGITGVANNVFVGPGAQVGAASLVTKDVPAGGTALGNPQRPYREHFRAHAKLNRLVARSTKDTEGS